MQNIEHCIDPYPYGNDVERQHIPDVLCGDTFTVAPIQSVRVYGYQAYIYF